MVKKCPKCGCERLWIAYFPGKRQVLDFETGRQGFKLYKNP